MSVVNLKARDEGLTFSTWSAALISIGWRISMESHWDDCQFILRSFYFELVFS